MPLETGAWTINSNGLAGQLQITNVTGDGILTGTITLPGFQPAAINGYWDEIQQRVAFTAFLTQAGVPIPPGQRFYTGYLFAGPDAMRIGGVAGAVLFNLAGVFQEFTTATAKRNVFGWYAQIGTE